jgi:hypothetical protein
MATPSALMRLGLPAQQAKRLGIDMGSGSSLLAGGAAYATATAIGQFAIYVRANAQSGANVYQMPSNAEIGTEYVFYNLGGITGGVTANLYPPAGGTFNIGSTSATSTLTAVTSGKGLFLIAITASTFDVLLSA